MVEGVAGEVEGRNDVAAGKVVGEGDLEGERGGQLLVGRESDRRGARRRRRQQQRVGQLAVAVLLVRSARLLVQSVQVHPCLEGEEPRAEAAPPSSHIRPPS